MSVSVQSNYNSQSKNNYFKYSNIIDDVWAKQLSPVKNVLCRQLLRLTYGWGKTIDTISHSQLQKRTNYSRSTIIKNLNELVNEKKVGRLKTGENGVEEYNYYLIFEEESENSNISYPSENCTPPLSENCTHHINKEIKKEKIYKKEKEAKEESMHIHGCISLPQSAYDDAVKTHTKAFVDNLIDRMDTFYSTNPDRAKKGGCYASKLHLWIKNELKNKQRKKQSEELAFRQKEEEDRQFQIQQEAVRAEKQRQEAIQTKAIEEKIKEKIPIVKQFEEKFPGIVRLCRIWQNGVCEVKDRLHRIHHIYMQYDDFEDQLTRKLREVGCLC